MHTRTCTHTCTNAYAHAHVHAHAHAHTHTCKHVCGSILLQLKLYAQQRSDHVTITDEYFAKAVEDHKDSEALGDYRNATTEINLFISLLVVVPFGFLILICTYMKGARWQLRKRLTNADPAVHASLAAVAVTGFILSLFVLGTDIIALQRAHAHNEFEHSKADVHPFHNLRLLWITAVTFTLDLIFVCSSSATLILVSVLEYSNCLAMDRTSKYQDCVFHVLTFGVFCCKGIYTRNEKNEERNKEQRLWLTMGIFIAPIGCLGTHTGYIIVAWLSFPMHAGAVFLMYMLTFVFYFFTFRQLYLFCTDRLWRSNNKDSTNGKGIELGSPHDDKKESKKYAKKKGFQYWVILVEIPVGVVLVLLQAWFTSGILLLPITDVVERAPMYLQSLTATIILTVAGLISFKVLVVNPTAENAMHKKLTETWECMYNKNHGKNIHEPLTESTECEKIGFLLGTALYHAGGHGGDHVTKAVYEAMFPNTADPAGSSETLTNPNIHDAQGHEETC